MNEPKMANWSRREFVKMLGVGTGLLAVPMEWQALAVASGQRPNIVLILADDLGYECLGANGGISYRTPVLDRLAANGARFTHCYAQPLCTPTRVQLMTGMYNVRNYTEFGSMDPAQVTFANILMAAGYATCIAGKWQLGREVDSPRRFGFDEHYLWQHTRRPPRYANPGLEINGVEKDYTEGEYGPDLISDCALDFITRKKDTPFFLYYPMILPHSPFVPTPDSPDWNPKAKEGEADPRHFGEMVTYMDQLVGKVLAKLDELKIRENTLVIFTGDNGTGNGITTDTISGPVQGGKGQGTDAGMHVPLIVSQLGTVKPGVCGDLIDSTDFLPTICQSTGVAVPAQLTIDGRSFLPQLRGQEADPRPWTYCWFARNGGPKADVEFARTHRYKLYRDGRFYDLLGDANEALAIDPTKLEGEALAAHKLLETALNQYQDARPVTAAAKKGGRSAGK